MTSGTGRNPGTGQHISLTIPVQDPELFKFGATNGILIVLTNNRYNEYSIRELTKYTDYAFDSVRTAVDTLAANDLILETREGNRRAIRINRDRLHIPDDPILRIPQSEFHHPVKEATNQLTRNLDDVVGVVLYGSVARGEADRRSDIDLWVLTDAHRGDEQREANRIARNLEDATFNGQRYDFHVDVESVQSIPRYTENIREIIGLGIPLYETDTFEQVKALIQTTGVQDE